MLRAAAPRSTRRNLREVSGWVRFALCKQSGGGETEQRTGDVEESASRVALCIVVGAEEQREETRGRSSPPPATVDTVKTKQTEREQPDEGEPELMRHEAVEQAMKEADRGVRCHG